jgi:hypothetical protein
MRHRSKQLLRSTDVLRCSTQTRHKILSLAPTKFFFVVFFVNEAKNMSVLRAAQSGRLLASCISCTKLIGARRSKKSIKPFFPASDAARAQFNSFPFYKILIPAPVATIGEQR